MVQNCDDSLDIIAKGMVKLYKSNDDVVSSFVNTIQQIQSKEKIAYSINDVAQLNDARQSLARYTMYRLSGAEFDRYWYFDAIIDYHSRYWYYDMDSTRKQLQWLRWLQPDELKDIGFTSEEVETIYKGFRTNTVNQFLYLEDTKQTLKQMYNDPKAYNERLENSKKVDVSEEDQLKKIMNRIDERGAYFQNEIDEIEKIWQNNFRRFDKEIRDQRVDILRKKDVEYPKRKWVYTNPERTSITKQIEKDISVAQELFNDRINKKLAAIKKNGAGKKTLEKEKTKAINKLIQDIFGEWVGDEVLWILVENASLLEDVTSIMIYKAMSWWVLSYPQAAKYLSAMTKSIQKAFDNLEISEKDLISDGDFDKIFWSKFTSKTDREALLHQYMASKIAKTQNDMWIVDRRVIDAVFALNWQYQSSRYLDNAQLYAVLSKYGITDSTLSKAKQNVLDIFNGKNLDNVPREFLEMDRKDQFAILGITDVFLDDVFGFTDSSLKQAYGLDYKLMRDEFIIDLIQRTEMDAPWSVASIRNVIDANSHKFMQKVKKEIKHSDIQQSIMRYVTHNTKQNPSISLYNTDGTKKDVIFIDNDFYKRTPDELWLWWDMYEDLFRQNTLSTWVRYKKKLDMPQGSEKEMVERLQNVVQNHSNSILIFSNYRDIQKLSEGSVASLLGNRIELWSNQLFLPMAGAKFIPKNAYLNFAVSSSIKADKITRDIWLEMTNKSFKALNDEVFNEDLYKNILDFKFAIREENIDGFFKGIDLKLWRQDFKRMTNYIAYQESIIWRKTRKINVQQALLEINQWMSDPSFKRNIIEKVYDMFGYKLDNIDFARVKLDPRDVFTALYINDKGYYNIAKKIGIPVWSYVPYRTQHASFSAAFLQSPEINQLDIIPYHKWYNELIKVLWDDPIQLQNFIEQIASFDWTVNPDDFIQDKLSLLDDLFGGIENRRSVLWYLWDVIDKNKLYNEEKLLATADSDRFAIKMIDALPTLLGSYVDRAHDILKNGVPLIDDFSSNGVIKWLFDDFGDGKTVDSLLDELNRNKRQYTNYIKEKKQDPLFKWLPINPRKQTHQERIQKKIDKLNIDEQIENVVDAKAMIKKAKSFHKGKKAKTKVSSDPLVQEARKYKSADEFVSAQGTPVYRGQTKKGGVDFNETRFQRNTEGGVFFTPDQKTARKYGDNIVENISTKDNTISVKEFDQLQKMATRQLEKDIQNNVETDELIEQMALWRPKAFAEYTKKPFVVTWDEFWEAWELIYYKEFDQTPEIVTERRNAWDEAQSAPTNPIQKEIQDTYKKLSALWEEKKLTQEWLNYTDEQFEQYLNSNTVTPEFEQDLRIKEKIKILDTDIQQRQKELKQLVFIQDDKAIDKLEKYIAYTDAQKELDDLQKNIKKADKEFSATKNAPSDNSAYVDVEVDEKALMSLWLQRREETIEQNMKEEIASTFVQIWDKINVDPEPALKLVDDAQNKLYKRQKKYVKDATALVKRGGSKEDFSILYDEYIFDVQQVYMFMERHFGDLIQQVYTNKSYVGKRMTKWQLFNLSVSPASIRGQQSLDTFQTAVANSNSFTDNMFKTVRTRILETVWAPVSTIDDAMLLKPNMMNSKFIKSIAPEAWMDAMQKIDRLLTNGSTSIITKTWAQRVTIEEAIFWLTKSLRSTYDDVDILWDSMKNMDLTRMPLSRKSELFANLRLYNKARDMSLLTENVNFYFAKMDETGNVRDFLQNAEIVMEYDKEILWQVYIPRRMKTMYRDWSNEYNLLDMEYLFTTISKDVSWWQKYKKNLDVLLDSIMPYLQTNDKMDMIEMFSDYYVYNDKIKEIKKNMPEYINNAFQKMDSVRDITLEMYQYTGKRIYDNIDVIEGLPSQWNTQLLDVLSPRTQEKNVKRLQSQFVVDENTQKMIEKTNLDDGFTFKDFCDEE